MARGGTGTGVSERRWDLAAGFCPPIISMIGSYHDGMWHAVIRHGQMITTQSLQWKLLSACDVSLFSLPALSFPRLAVRTARAAPKKNTMISSDIQASIDDQCWIRNLLLQDLFLSHLSIGHDRCHRRSRRKSRASECGHASVRTTDRGLPVLVQHSRGSLSPEPTFAQRCCKPSINIYCID